MDPTITEIKADIENELAACSTRLKSYVKTIEALLEGAEASASGRWITYAVVAFVSAVVGHFI